MDKNNMSLLFTRIMSCETKDFAFINIYEYSNFESHKDEVTEHFKLLEEKPFFSYQLTNKSL
jgi:hypothetical protein